MYGPKARWKGMAVVAMMVAIGIGCTPEKPSSATDARELALEAGEGDDLEDGEAVVARVGGEAISREEFHRRISGMRDFARVRLQSKERQEDLLGRILEFEVMADAAEIGGYGHHAAVRQAMKKTMVELMIEDRLRDEVSMAEIDDKARADYFDAHGADFYRPERRRVARLWVSDKERAEELRDRWNDEAPTDVTRRGTAFRQFAFQQSEERKSGDQGGDAGWRVAGDVDELDEPVFDWEPAKVQGPFEQEGGWVLKMIVEVEEAQQPEAGELEQEITTRIYENRRDQIRREVIDELTADADVELVEDRLEGLKAPTPRVSLRATELPRQVIEDDKEIEVQD